ncbi:myb-like protein P isoform X6 [Zeugodacus cucurbitae]|uniref:myb-like protein P isoform X6 n=1 Tax=Zeugodacus cucurbitae TaxID=28588 RepID=UPI0023D93184|nr:myb-like protein P isoform X6 [Zeugodacus cucurbitae]
MDSTTESKEVKQNEESNNVVEELSTEEVEIEDCSDSSESVVAEPTKIQNTEAEHKVVGSEKQDEEEVVELVGENNSEEEEVEAGNVPSQPEIVIEYDRESANTSPAPTPTATVVIAQQNVAHSKLEDNKENKVLNEGKGEETENAEEANKTVLSEDSVVENKQVESSENTETTISQDQVDAVQPGQSKEENWNNTIKNIISDIDSNIEQENCDLLKQQQKELLQKQQELVQQIRQQQLIAQKLADENRLHQQQLQQQQLQQQQLQQQQLQQQQLQQQQLQQQQLQQQQLQQQQLQQQQLQQQQLQQQQSQPESSPQPKTQNLISTFEQASTPTPSQHKENISKYSTVEETKDEFGYTKNTETYEFKESTNASKHIDLHKIFTPATDNDAVLPRNRKLYSSSAFYSPALHPTVEDQVELARRISHSLSDISNQKSKGQSMYVNRKKRSVKWVHEGAGQDSTIKEKNYQEEFKENNVSLIKTTQPTTQNSAHNQVPLRFLMNPLGKVRDITSVSDSFNIETGLLSPDKCAELITALQTQKGKGAELFAKRRRKSEKWVVDDKSARTESPSGLPDYQQQQQQFKPATSPSILPAYSDAGKHRVQLNLHQEQVLEKYVKPGLKVVKTPWEAALETGSASTAFLDDDSRTQQTSTPALSPAPVAQYQYTDPTNIDTTPYKNGLTADYSIAPSQEQSQSYFPTVKPNFGHNPQRELAYKPSLPQGWKAPSPSLPKELYVPKEISLESYAPPPVVISKEPEHYKPSWQQASATTSSASTFPLARPSHGGFRSYAPPNSDRPVQHQTVPQINYNPSPLSYDKIAKFENADEQQAQNNEYNAQTRRLPIRSNVDKVQNIVPAAYQRPANIERLPTTPYQSNLRPTDINVNYNRFPTPVYIKRINPNEILHGQNYNNTARGWKSSGISSYKSPCDNSFKTPNIESCGIYQQVPLTAANTLPYTDF